MDYDGSDHQFVIALDKRNGQTVWKTDRSIDFKDLGPGGKPMADGDMRKAFSTPRIATFRDPDGNPGKPILISGAPRPSTPTSPRPARKSGGSKTAPPTRAAPRR